LGLHDTGVIAEGRRADLVVLDRRYRVRQTYLAGVPALEP
jgi:N-acetylglucosamine-6-phosphate deacetylase